MRMTTNAKRVMESGAEIVRKLREGAMIVPLTRQYRCGYYVLMAAILAQISKAQYRRIVHAHRAGAGKKTGFQPGHVAWNTGRKGWCAKGTEATRFKPGGIRGAAARNYRPVGSVTVRRDKDTPNYYAMPRVRFSRWIKVKDDGRPQDRYIPYARYLWQREHGPVPAGCFVGHRDNNTMNDNPDNLVLVAGRREHIARLKARPDVEAKRRHRTSIVSKRRHAANRAAKKWAKAQKRQGGTVWECAGCGADSPVEIEKCPKCGSWSVERRKIGPMPNSMVREGMERDALQEAAYG